MELITIYQARAQARLEPDYPDDQLQPYIDGAEKAAAAYLNRKIYSSLYNQAVARSEYPSKVAAAKQNFDLEVQQASEGPDDEKEPAINLAKIKYKEALAVAEDAITGILVNESIIAAILLIFGHLFANRESVVIGQTAVEVPQGAKDLLRPYRRVMMP